MTTEGSNNSLVNLVIDGKNVSVKAGTTIMEAAKETGLNIPHFCWHPGLSVAGVCRLCMVKVEGNPKMQIACNTPVSEGMKVETKAEEAKQAQKWALEFHLVNHPLDCPICDQAGECKLQDYFMSVGRYDSQVEESKVLKPKALDVGKNLILDTERCILCSRCVRFEDEITQTGSLGIFDRGDRSCIGLMPGRRIDHNYSYNLADICPVGAFTVKDFRFKCRVWFLTESESICPGCSTGCSVTLYRNKNQREYYRLRPRHNEKTNGHWMCDYGRTMYEHLNAEKRSPLPRRKGVDLTWAALSGEIQMSFKETRVDDIAVVLTAQYTCEEYDVLFKSLKKRYGTIPRVYLWRPAHEKPDDFDGILFRGDHNPNTKGLAETLQQHGVQATTLPVDFAPLISQKPGLTVVMGPEVEKAFPNLEESLARLTELPCVIYFGVSMSAKTREFHLSIPTKVFAEKKGTYINFSGVRQQLQPNPTVYPNVMGIDDIFETLADPAH